MPPPETPKPNSQKPAPNKRKKIPENIRKIVSQNVNGLTQSWKLEMIINRMIEVQYDAFLIQETWLTGNWEKEIRGYLVIHHNHEKDKLKKRGQEKRGVAIVLSPYFRKASEDAGSPKSIRTSQKRMFSGRFIGITLQFPNTDSYGKS